MLPPPRSLHIRKAVHALSHSGVIACPTEAVWGLSCDPADEEAVLRLLTLKRRAVAKGLILVASSADQLDFLLSGLTDTQQQTVSESWPGPSTWLVPHRGLIPDWIHGEHDKVAVRVSAHPLVSALCSAWDGPLVSTSANPAGLRPAREAFQVQRYFGRDLDYLLPGRLGAANQPSSITDLISGQILRD